MEGDYCLIVSATGEKCCQSIGYQFKIFNCAVVLRNNRKEMQCVENDQWITDYLKLMGRRIHKLI